MEKNTFFKDYQNLINSFEALKKDKENPFFKSKYVTLNQILPIVKKNCTDNNFIFSQFPEVREGKNVLVTNLEHISGRVINGSVEIVSKDTNDPQKVGAGITYMRRYSLVTMLGLEDEDDDGNVASNQTYTPAANQVMKEKIDGEKPWITNDTFNKSIAKLLEKGVITKEFTEDEIMRVLRTKFKVAKHFKDLIPLALTK